MDKEKNVFLALAFGMGLLYSRKRVSLNVTVREQLVGSVVWQ